MTNPICLLTVPHSATTWVRKSFQKQVDDGFLVFGHFGLSPRLIRNLDKRRVMVVLRDPLATFCTHAHMEWTTRNISRERLLEIYREQIAYVQRYSPQVFPIERTTRQEIGAWMGTDPVLRHHYNSFGMYPLKVARVTRDEERLVQLLGDDWRWFKEVLTPEIADFYIKHNYDLWWK